MNTARFILLLTIAAIGCSKGEKPITSGCSKGEKPITSVLPESAQRVSNIEDALAAAVTESKPVCFRSWNGRWIGMDCDTEIELYADGKVALTEYGYVVRKYEGTYSVSATTDGMGSELALTFQEYRGEWPVMAVCTDQTELLLIPTEGSAGFVFGNRAGAWVPGGAGSFWPFRQIRKPTTGE